MAKPAKIAWDRFLSVLLGTSCLFGFSVQNSSVRLSVFPNVCHIEPGNSSCRVEVSWENYSSSSQTCIFVYTPGSERLFTCGASGRAYPSWVSASPIEFRLRAGNTSSATLLASAPAVGINISSQLSTQTLAAPHVQQDGNPITLGAISGFWDSRLFLTAVSVSSDPSFKTANRFGWAVYLMRPEVATLSQNKKFLTNTSSLLSMPGLYSKSYLLDSDVVPPGSSLACPSYLAGCTENWNVNRANINGRLQVAPFPDPNFKENPYPSDPNGVYNSSGSYATYRFYLVGQAATIASYDIAILNNGLYNDMGFLTMIPGQVVVANPKTVAASVYSAAILGPGTPMLDTKGNPLICKEPSVSLDGRLVACGALPHMFDSNFIDGYPLQYISFNQSPGAASGWSPLTIVDDAYYLYGPGAVGGELIVDGKPFSQRFPFASCPMKDWSGNLFESSARGQPVFGGNYNWVSPDASEIFSGIMPTFYGPARRAWSMAGRRTGCKMVNVDTSMNPMRGNPFGSNSFLYQNLTKGQTLADANTQLVAAYNSMPQPNSAGAAVVHNWEHVLPSPIFVSPGAWNPWRDIAGLPIPENSEHEVYGLTFSGGQRYAEAPILDHQADLILALPMNELISYDAALAYNDAYVSGYSKSHKHIWPTNFDSSHTPDLSQFSQNGTLMNGAQFPFEYNDVIGNWKNNNKLLDANEGARGNSVFMPSGAYVSVTLSKDAVSMIGSTKKYTLSFWVRRQNAGQSTLFSIPNLINIGIDTNGNLSIAQSNSNNGATSTQNTVLPMPSLNWTHVAVSYHLGESRVYINGELAAPPAALGSLLVPGASLVIGPQSAVGSNRVDMDEVMMYDIALEPDDIARLAFRRVSEVENSGVSVGLKRNLATSSAVAQIPAENPYTASAAAINLGKTLFNTTALSGNKKVSCASCHSGSSFSDSVPVSVGFDGPGFRNSPPLIDLAFVKKQFHDGSAPSLESQVLHPIIGGEFGGNAFTLLDQIKADPNLLQQFNAVYGRGPNFTLLARSLANFVRSLTAGNSSFDTGTMSASSQRGFELFRGRANCIACHNGPDLSDGQLHDTGERLISSSILPKGDLGAYWIQGAQSYLSAFKTSSLRNISATGPYFHDGRFTTLHDVLNFYNNGGDAETLSRYGRDGKVRPLDLSEQDMKDIESYLNELSSSVGQ